MGNNSQKVIEGVFDDPDDLQHFKKLFNLYDKDHNESLDPDEFNRFKAELVKYLKKFKTTYGAKKDATQEEIQELSKSNQKKARRLTELSEFAPPDADLSVLSSNSLDKQVEYQTLQLDLNKSVEKLTKMQEGTYDFVADLEKIKFNDIDVDGNGRIDFTEFSNILSKRIKEVKFE
jgi:Ca2+-binding EF-hand superfamily protein